MTAEQRRESILVAATVVFAEAGYERGKAAEVARRVGVSEPVVFQNFGSKAALYVAVVDRATDQVCVVLDQEQLSVAGLLAAALEPGRLERIHAPGSIGAIFADAASVTGVPDIEAAARRSTRRLADALTAVLTRGRDTGELRADLDPETSAWWLLSLVASQRFRQSTAEDPVMVETRLAEATLAFLTTRGSR
jgi:AcrR family transcriptional regulator